RQWGVGWRNSTDEAVEQSNGSSTRGSGEGGGKGANQGERPAGTRGPGTARSSRVTGSEGRAESGQGEEAGTVHYVAAPSDCQSAAGQLLRTETCGCGGRGRGEVGGMRRRAATTAER